jgi:hypothetical protein
MKKLIIDRFEGQYAVCEQEDRKMVDIEKKLLPDEAAEGSCIIIRDDGKILLDKNETGKRKDRISKLMDDLFE